MTQDGHLTVIAVRLTALSDALERLHEHYGRPGKRARYERTREHWRDVQRNLERVGAAVEKARAGGAPRGMNGRPE